MNKSSAISAPVQRHGGAFDCVTQPCRQGPGAGGGWTMEDMLAILCGSEPGIVEDAGKTQKVYKVDRVFFEDKEFDGQQWQTVLFEAGGTAGGGEITMLSSTTAEAAATTLYHEVWHTRQPAGMGWPHPAEDDAYYNTELWTISNGLPSQGHPPLRTTNGSGQIVPDKTAIKNFVDQVYPISDNAAPGWRAFDYKEVPPETHWYNDGTGMAQWKPAQVGDSVPGPQQVVNKQLIPAEDFKCP